MRVLPFSALELLTTVIRRDFRSICLYILPSNTKSEIDQYPPIFVILPIRSRVAQVK